MATPAEATGALDAGCATFDSTLADSSLTGAFTTDEVVGAEAFFTSARAVASTFTEVLEGFLAASLATVLGATLVLAALVLAVFAATFEACGAVEFAATTDFADFTAVAFEPAALVVFVEVAVPTAVRAADDLAAEVTRVDTRGVADFAAVLVF